MSTSRLQDLFLRKTRYVLEPLGYTVLENHRPKWLKTKSSLRRLELDVFIPEIDVAVEIHGKQHFEHVPFFHQTPDDFERAIRMDMEKRIACIENGVVLFELDSEERLDDIMRSLCKMIPLNPLGLNRARKYKQHKRKQLQDGEFISLVHFGNGDVKVCRDRLATQVENYYSKNEKYIKRFWTKLSPAPHGEYMYYRALLERGMIDRAFETFMDYGQPLYQIDGKENQNGN